MLRRLEDLGDIFFCPDGGSLGGRDTRRFKLVVDLRTMWSAGMGVW